MFRVILLKGKARIVFNLIALMAQNNPDMTIGELAKGENE